MFKKILLGIIVLIVMIMIITEPTEVTVVKMNDNDNFKVNREHIIKRLQNAIKIADYKTVDDIFEAYSFTKDKELLEIIKINSKTKSYLAYKDKLSKEKLIKEKHQQYIYKYGEIKKDYKGIPVAVENYLLKRMNDPDSLNIQSCTSVTKTEDGYRTRCSYRGKNSFGALVLETKSFLIIHNKVIEVK